MARKRMRGAWLAATLLLGITIARAATDPLTDELLRRPTWEKVVISPDGQSLAVAHRTGDQSMVSVFRRSDMQVIAEARRGKDGEIDALSWLGPKRLIIGVSSPYRDSTLYLLEIGQTHPKPLPASFIGTIEGDDQHVIVRSCRDFDKKGNCLFEARRLDIEHLSRDGDVIAKAPIADASFMADHSGTVRFSWARDDEGNSKLYVKSGGDWTLLNDSTVSGTHVAPYGISRDNRQAILLAGRRDGPDVIERYDFATGERSVLLADPRVSPRGIILSMDHVEPIGAWFGDGRPTARYWDGVSTDEQRWRQSLIAAFPDGTPAIVNASADGHLVVVSVTSDRDPGSFYLLDRDSHKAQLLFHSKPGLDPQKLATIDSFSFKARDGVLLHGLISVPPGSDGRHLPMVVVPHGGPYGISDTWEFDTDTQVLATHGYAVLRVNFRGSSGYGQQFEMLGYKQWGRAMQDDVTDATHWAIDRGIADPGRICIFGASYGGYAALMGAIREPGLYRCAIGLAGVYDLAKMYRWGDIYRSNYGLNYLTRVLGRDPADLASRSPLANVDAIKVPVLLAHGARDGRVPVDHARAMDKALRHASKTVSYVEYPEEGHGLYLDEDKLDFYARLLNFLDIQLKPGDAKVATPAP